MSPQGGPAAKALKRPSADAPVLSDSPAGALVLHVGKLVAENVFVTAGGERYLYDLHATPDGGRLIMTTEVLGYDERGRGGAVQGTIRLGEDSYLLPYSGFTFASGDYPRQPDVAADDHIYYQGPVLRGVELVVFGEDHAALKARTEELIPAALERLARLV